jgi:PEP-CTERM motif
MSTRPNPPCCALRRDRRYPYTIALPPAGDLTLTGTITTNGNLGALTLPDFLDWDLTLSSASLSAGYEFLGPAHGPTSNSTPALAFSNIVATDTSLFLPYPGVFLLESIPGCGNPVPCGQAIVTPVPPGGNNEIFRVCTAAQVCDAVQIGLPISGVQLANAGVQLAAVPEPSTLGLIGLGLLGLGAMRRRRRNS